MFILSVPNTHPLPLHSPATLLPATKINRLTWFTINILWLDESSSVTSWCSYISSHITFMEKCIGRQISTGLVQIWSVALRFQNCGGHIDNLTKPETNKDIQSSMFLNLVMSGTGMLRSLLYQGLATGCPSCLEGHLQLALESCNFANSLWVNNIPGSCVGLQTGVEDHWPRQNLISSVFSPA